MEDLILNLLLYICPQYLHFVTFQIPPLCGEVTNVQAQATEEVLIHLPAQSIFNSFSNYDFHPDLQMKLHSCHMDVHVSVCPGCFCIPRSNLGELGRVMLSQSRCSLVHVRQENPLKGASPAKKFSWACRTVGHQALLALAQGDMMKTHKITVTGLQLMAVQN